MRRVAFMVFGLALGCSSAGSAPEPGPKVRLWHTFDPTETAALNSFLAGRGGGLRVETTLVPFQRGQTILAGVLREGRDCPDLVRMDATWIPGLAREGLLSQVPAELGQGRTWLPESLELASDRGQQYGVPQRLDGLALIYRADTVAKAGVPWPPQTLGALLAASRQMTGGGDYGLGVRVDGYWFAAFLRAWGGQLLDPTTGSLGVDQTSARVALTRFAEMFAPGGIAGPPPPSGAEAQDEYRRFRTGNLAVAIDGPWAVTGLGGVRSAGLAVAPFPRAPDGRPAAPRGGQMLVVPTCARAPADAWQLARELTEPSLQAAWARQLGAVPTTEAALADAGELARSFYRALVVTRPLPRHPATAEMFDDLNPAIAAVVAGDATADEALDGVVRAWTRLLARHQISAAPPPTPPTPIDSPERVGPSADGGGAQ